MDRDDLVAEGLEGVLNLLFIAIVSARNLGIGDEENLVLRATVELLVLLARKIEVARRVVAGARLDEDAALFAHLLSGKRLLDLGLGGTRNARKGGDGAENGALHDRTA